MAAGLLLPHEPMALLTVEVNERLLPQEDVSQTPWPSPEVTKRAGTSSLWIVLKDIHGLGEASIAVARLRGRSHDGRLDSEALRQRNAILDVVERIIRAEREIMIRELNVLLNAAVAKEP